MGEYAKYKERWKDCKLCPLHKKREQVVLARGKIPCDILFIGEAPGESENVLGQPFVGPAGHLLDQIIGQALTNGERYAMTNLVACIPKGENGDKLSEPSRDDIVACGDRLDEFIEIAKPKKIIAVGKLAEKHLPKTLKIQHDSAIHHPAFLLRMNVVSRPLEIKRAVVTIREVADSL